jgi:hypothetical protein
VLAAAAVCPHPPLLHPALAPGADAALDHLRTACLAAVSALLAAAPDVVVCVGEGPEPARYDESDGGSLRRFGVGVSAGGDGSDALPLALTLGAWLLDGAGWAGPRRYVALPQEMPPHRCVEAGRHAAEADLRVGVLAMGDGSAKRSEAAPGYLDDRAGPFDAEVARALGAPDPGWLADGLPPIACAELWVAGRPAWQFLAGAAARTPDGAALRARTRYDAAPHGVGYFVVDWSAGASSP